MEPTKKEKKKKIYIGTVVSDKMDKTIVVKAERTFQDRRFHKIIRKTKKYKVHDEHKQAKKGDTVIFYEGQPCSKMKYMYLERVVKSNFVDTLDV